MLNKDQAVDKLQRQAGAVEPLKQKQRGSSEFKKWCRDTEIAIENIFGNDTRHVEDFTKIRYHLGVWSTSTPDYEYQRAYVSGLDRAYAIISSMIDEINEYWQEDSILASASNALAQLENICRKFHVVSRQLRSRYNGRPTIEVEDEYDVQDVMHSILLLQFDDVRREEWTPSYAGGCSRADFLLKNERTVVEIKKTRKGLEAKQVGEQLIIDIQRYKVHPDCQTLICFVYDPEGRVSNPRGIERDLNESTDGMIVKVIIAPSGL